jgi:DNA repair protein RadA/Sms
LPLHTCDVFCNVVGGLRLSEPAADLPTALAIISSLTDSTLAEGTVAFGELGLSGEVRIVNRAAERVAEAAKLGFARCLLPAGSVRQLRDRVVPGIELVAVSTIQEAMRHVVAPPGAGAQRKAQRPSAVYVDQSDQ